MVAAYLCSFFTMSCGHEQVYLETCFGTWPHTGRQRYRIAHRSYRIERYMWNCVALGFRVLRAVGFRHAGMSSFAMLAQTLVGRRASWIFAALRALV